MTTTIRELQYATSGQQSTDGDGVKLTRLIGNAQVNMLDPFLLLDSFESDQPQDYIGGFPSHPHRGFETVTYMLKGKMRHKDSAGNEGVIKANGVQWMTAGKGIVHSEMPEQTDGMLHGLQLWVNLPKSHKMTKPAYQEYPEALVPKQEIDGIGQANVIAGKTDSGTEGIVNNRFVAPTYIDVQLAKSKTFHQSLVTDHNAFIYVISGELSIGNSSAKLATRKLGILTKGEKVKVTANKENTRFILVAGKPLNEPVVRGGPFVMNTKKELMQAFEDFSKNRF